MYHVVKTSHSLIQDKAPSRADIQQKLIAEEYRDHSIRGQTSWILCGIKIQEMQYVHIQYTSFTHQTDLYVDFLSDINSGVEGHI